MPRTLTAEQVEDFRDELCRVAASHFARDGYDAVTMRALAGEIGVSAMTPYRYFESKGAIYREVRARSFMRFGSRVAEAARDVADPVERLRRLFHAYLDFATDEPGAYRIMFEFEPPADAEPSPQDRALTATTWGPLLQTLQDVVDQDFAEGDPLTLAHLCWTQVHGLASLHIANRLNFERSLDELREPLVDALLTGILTRPRGKLRVESLPED